jgi:uncharacterized protein YlaI
MKLTETIYSILLKEYSEGVMRKLIEKFKLEQNNLSDAVIISYINDFKKISQKLENRDIMTYSWKDLENTVDSNRSTRIKAGKIDVTAEDANLLYNSDGIRIYHGKDKTACIKYSNGYSFCIGARGDRNLYSTYRYHDNSEKEKVGTPYFVFNDNLDKKDRNHILVIFEFSIKDKLSSYDGFYPNHYTVTNADNTGDKRYDDFHSIVVEYPWAAPLKDLMIENKGLTHDEKMFHKLLHDQESKAYLLGKEFLDKYSVNEIKQYYFRKLFNFLFESADPWHNRNQTPREKYDAMMKGMNHYRCGFDRFDMMQRYDRDGERDNNLYDFIKKVNEEASFYLLADPENFTPYALDYIKRFVMPWAQDGFDGIEGETYDKVIEYALYSFDKRKRVQTDLEQLSAITLGTRQVNIDLIELIKEYDKVDLIKKKYAHLV